MADEQHKTAALAESGVEADELRRREFIRRLAKAAAVPAVVVAVNGSITPANAR